MKTYNIGGSEFTLKDFRKAGNRKTYWLEYNEIGKEIYEGDIAILTNVMLISMRVQLYCAKRVYKEVDGVETVCFDTFLKPFLDGDFSKITELQGKDEEQGNLMQLCVEVISDFFTLNLNGDRNSKPTE